MKVVLIVLVVVAVALAHKHDAHDSKFEHFDPEAVVADPAVFKTYRNCFFEEGDCPPEGGEFKKILLESLSDSCGKCSPKERHIIRTLVKGIQADKPEKWDELMKRHDPEVRHKESFEKFLRSSE